jgi:hypothetical protein
MKKFLFEISPETRSLLADAWRKPTLLERWSADQRLLNIIAKVRASGEPGAIGHLLHLGLAESASVRSAAREAIRDLLALIPTQGIPELDEAVRREWGYLDVWYGLRPETVAATRVNADEDAAFLRVATCHQSGYVREQAIKGLAQDESSNSLPFLIVRSVDWVAQVRVAAQLEIYRRLQRRYVDAFVSCLSLLDRLRGSQRFAPELCDSIKRFLQGPNSAEALQKGFQSNDRIVRRHSFTLAVENPGFNAREVVESAAADTDVRIRKWAFTFSQSEMSEHWPELCKRAVRDPFSAIRRIAFESLIAEPAPRADQLVGFLLDSSPAMRHSAQDLLPKLNISVPDYYRAALDTNQRPRSICALGLAEVGDANDALRIMALMQDSLAKTRSAAVRALRILGLTDSDLLFRALHSDVASVAREAVISLLSARVASADVIWKQTLVNEDPIVWRTILKSFNDVGKWVRLKVYLEAVATTDAGLSTFAVERLRIWLAQYNRSFTIPQTSDATQIPALLDGVCQKLPSDVTRELGFVIETVLKPAQKAYASDKRTHST